ncbi:MAG: alpha/beta fold hydrolase [Bacteroidales bacterium]|nr:alpha/beta fold hydrolase [Bacteroidales bacterium]
MKLFFRHLGSGEPLIILHGLYGSSDNWHSMGRELSAEYSVYLVDQRNHGNSPHSSNHNYDLLSDDLQEFMKEHNLDSAYIIGHSMGGRAVLHFGLKYPERVRKLIVVDISPMGNEFRQNAPEIVVHNRIIGALQQIDINLITSRDEADKLLQQSIALSSIRQFLLKNLKRTPEGKFRWAFNLKTLSEKLPDIFTGIIRENETNPESIPQFPLLFIKGALSGYIRPEDEASIRKYFPWSEITIIPGAGHWVHAEQPAAFLKAVREFL